MIERQTIVAAWETQTSALSAAQAAEDAYDRLIWTPANAVTDGKASAEIEAEMQRLQDARCDLEDQTVATSAPTLTAAIWKIDYARKRWSDFEDWPPAWWEAVMADLRRLDGQAEREALFRDFDRLDAEAAVINAGSPSDEELDVFGEEHGAAFRRTIALPNTVDNLRIRARALGSCCNYSADVANLDLNELSAHAEGYAGELVRQVLTCLMQTETIR